MKTIPVESILKYLSSQQRRDGGILGKASADPQNFQKYRTHTTTFFSALILESLQGIPESNGIRQGLADFLVANRSADWTWNYWIRGSQADRTQPYPDDLDDTCCALAALTHQQADIVSGTTLARLAQALIANETAPGGPYETWLIDRQQQPDWHDVDLAVNANIGYFLSLQSVEVPGLMSYIADQLIGGTLKSSYYSGELPIIYFLARWYRGEGLEHLKAKILKHLKAHKQLDPLMLALLITSALRLDMDKSVLRTAHARLLSLLQTDHWSAAAFYGEPPVDSVAYYAGSEALTTAFALEAHYAYQQSDEKPQAHQSDTALLHSLRETEVALPDSELTHQYHRFVGSILGHDTDRQITGMATTTAAACGVRLPEATLTALNSASLHGWLAYTIYDNVWDGEPEPLLLGVANVALRQTMLQFRRALPIHRHFQTLVAQTLDAVDIANTWEFQSARAKSNRTNVTIKVLPEYGDYSQLASRSWGHSLAATGVLCLAGYPIASPEQHALRRFFHHYLIARQLNDDAHDWEDDLRGGQLSAVICMLIPSPQTIVFSRDLESLRLKFWEETIDTVVALIKQHVSLAREALQACPFRDIRAYEHWLHTVESAADLALSERQQTREFIAAYSGTDKPAAVTGRS